MGGEVFILIGAGLGGCTLAFLIYRVTISSARPCALPTIVFSAGVAAYEGVFTRAVGGVWEFLFWFLIAAIVFGAHAHAIRWLRERRT